MGRRGTYIELSKATTRTAVVWTGCLLILLPGCGDDSPTRTGDTTPPRAVHDLTAHAGGPATVELSWTSPGDNGDEGRASGFEVRGSRATFDAAGWETLGLLYAGRPREAGRLDSVTVRGLELGTWYFGVRVVDEAANWSALSNLASVDVIGVTPPDAIEDLRVAELTAAAVTLSWTAPETKDGAVYDVRYAEGELSDATWSAATQVEGEGPPGPAGSEESLVIAGLDAATVYVFGVKTANEPPNWSLLSNLVTATTDELEIRQITNSIRSYGARAPAWSPDGTRILFLADWEQEFHFQIYTIELSTLAVERLTNFDENLWEGQWSSDGTQIALIATRPDIVQNSKDLWTMPAQAGAAATRLASHAPRPIHDLTWSPDDTRIAYHVGSPFGGTTNPDSLFIVPTVGGHSEFLLSTGSRISGLAWSPDGNHIAFGGNQAGNFDIWIYSFESGDTRQLTDDPATEWGPVWSPSGEFIAFSSERSGNPDIWTVRTDGSEAPVQRTFAPTNEFDVTWAPDGEHLAFASFDNAVIRGDIFVLKLR